jgi:beta-alanine degradation protein BauB
MEEKAMSAEPVGTTLLFENDQVRVWEMVLPPGAECQPHRHQHDYLMLYSTPSTIEATLDDGRPVLQHLDAGMVAYRAVGQAGLEPHAISNAGPAASHHFVVELLGASSAPTARPPEHNGRGRTELRGSAR